ncbi:MAG: hypothetical protein QM804_15425 [Propionicimonas sp.]
MEPGARDSLVDLVTVAVPDWDEATVRALFPVDDQAIRLDRREASDERRGAPEIVGVVITFDGWEIAEALTAVERRLGEVHQLTGGPLSLRWRLSDRRIVILEPGIRNGSRLRIAPLEWTTYQEATLLDGGIASHAPYLWYVEIVKAPNGISFPGVLAPQGREELVGQLRAVCASLVEGVLLLPARVMKRANVSLTSPERLLRQNGMPYRPRVDFSVDGEPHEMSVSFDYKEIVSRSGDPATDLPVMMAEMMRAWSDWTCDLDDILITVYATAFTPGKRRPKPNPRKALHLTLGGSSWS